MSGVDQRSADVDIDIASLFSAVGRKWKRIAGFTLTATALAALYAFSATPKYLADARIFIGQQESVFTKPETTQAGNDPATDTIGVASQVEAIRSSRFLHSIAASLDEKQRAELLQAGPLAKLMDALAMFGLVAESESLPEDELVDRLRERLLVYAVDNTRVIAVSYTSSDPLAARDIANKVASAFLDEQRADKLDATKQASTLLKTEIDKLETSLQAAEGRIADFRAETGLLIGQNNSVLATQQLSEASSELTRVRASRATAKARAAAVAAAIRSGTSLDAIPEVLSSELIRRLREREVQLRTDIADLSVTLLDGHPRIKALRSQLADLQQQIRGEAAKVQKGLEQEAATAQLREEELVREVNRLKAASGQAGGQEVQLNELIREAEVLRRTLEASQSNYRKARAREEQNYAPADARVEEAITPAEPFAPKRPAIVGAAFAGSLLLSMIGVMLSELFSGRAMRPSRVVAAAPVRDVPMYDESSPPHMRATPIPQEPVAARADRTPSSLKELADIVGEETVFDTETREAEAMIMVPPLKATSRRAKQEAAPATQSTIRTLAERIVAGGLQRVVAVSPEGNEATAASIMLARFIADTGLRTLMIDLTANGALSSVTLDGAKLKGVTDILCGQAQFGDIIHPDLYSDAHVVPIGVANAARAIRAIERLPMIVNALNTAYEMVVIECGPTDPATVDRLVGEETVLVMNTIDPQSETVANSAAEFLDYGFEDVVMVTLQPGEGPGPRAGRSRAA